MGYTEMTQTVTTEFIEVDLDAAVLSKEEEEMLLALEKDVPSENSHHFSRMIDNGEGRRGFERDVAFVTTYTNASGQKVVDAVGGYGLRTGGSRNFDVTVFGYPGNRDEGERMWACWGRTTTHRWWTSSFPKITGCDFGGGSSGGPWLDDYNNSTGLGHVRSVTSFGPEGNSYNGGPYFDDAVMNLYNSTRKE